MYSFCISECFVHEKFLMHVISQKKDVLQNILTFIHLHMYVYSIVTCLIVALQNNLEHKFLMRNLLDLSFKQEYCLLYICTCMMYVFLICALDMYF